MQPSLFSDTERVASVFRGRRVAIVGSGPGVLDNEPDFIDEHDVVVRVNNHKCGERAGRRTDVHFSFYGGSIRKSKAELIEEGVTLCMGKCPNGQPIESPWHMQHGKLNGIDFRYIYRQRADWWFCPTFVPSTEHFLAGFDLLGGHIPTTGFAAILDVLGCAPASVFLTGFDFFSSGIHNVDEKWKPGDSTDPIGHVPHVELQWLRDNRETHPLTFDPRLATIMEG